MTEIFDGVFLGNRYTAKDAHFFQSHRITHVLNCTHDLKSYFQNMSSIEQRIYRPSSPTSSTTTSVSSSVNGETDYLDDDISDTSSVLSFASDISSVSSLCSTSSLGSTPSTPGGYSSLSSLQDDDQASSVEDSEPNSSGNVSDETGSSLGSALDMEKVNLDNRQEVESNKENLAPLRDNESNPILPHVVGERQVTGTMLPEVKTPYKSVQLQSELLVTPILLDENHQDDSTIFKTPTPKSKSTPRKKRRRSTYYTSRRRRSAAAKRTPRKRNPNDYVTVKYDFVEPVQYLRIKTVDSMEQVISQWFDEGTSFIFDTIRNNALIPNPHKEIQAESDLRLDEEEDAEMDTEKNNSNKENAAAAVVSDPTDNKTEFKSGRESEQQTPPVPGVDVAKIRHPVPHPDSPNDITSPITNGISHSTNREQVIQSDEKKANIEEKAASQAADNQPESTEKKEETEKGVQLKEESKCPGDSAKKPEHMPEFSDPDKRRCVLVHCREGRSRSVTMLIAFAMKQLGWSLKMAFEHVSKLTKGRTRINDGFKRQLMEYEKQLYGDNSMNFLPQRKRVRSYAEMTDAAFEAEIANGDSSYEPRGKRRKHSHKKHRNKNLLPASTISKFFPVVKEAPKKQMTLFDMFSQKKKKEPKEDKPEEKKPAPKQVSITSFFANAKSKSP